MDFIKQLDTLALGSRIRNLGDLLMKDMLMVYRDYNVEFEPRWFTTFQLIMHRHELAVTEIAKNLKQSHPAAVQVVNSLEKNKLIITKTDSKDRRRRLVRLSRKGMKLAEELSQLWEDVHTVANELISESAPDLMETLSKVEDALNSKSTYVRIKEKQEARKLNNNQ